MSENCMSLVLDPEEPTAIGVADKQGDLPDDVARFCDEALPEHSIYSFVRRESGQLFPDEGFAEELIADLLGDDDGNDDGPIIDEVPDAVVDDDTGDGGGATVYGDSAYGTGSFQSRLEGGRHRGEVQDPGAAHDEWSVRQGSPRSQRHRRHCHVPGRGHGLDRAQHRRRVGQVRRGVFLACLAPTVHEGRRWPEHSRQAERSGAGPSTSMPQGSRVDR